MLVNRKEFKDLEAFVQAGRGCATNEPSRTQITRVDEEIRASRGRERKVASVKIEVVFTHLTYGNLGHVSLVQRKDQIEILNQAFNQFGISFSFDEEKTQFVDDYSWYYMGQNSRAERDAKATLQVDPNKYLNFYTGGLQAGLLGWARFPFDFAGDPVLDGVVMLDGTLPDGDEENYNLGKTAIHEIGHWCGLYHTFQGGCSLYGDHVNDTVPHNGPNHGCPTEAENNACDSNQMAPFQNYMNYVYDRCMDEFTNDQGQRMLDQLAMYRPGFVNY